MTATTAANLLALSRGQIQRLLRIFRTEGPAEIRHKARFLTCPSSIAGLVWPARSNIPAYLRAELASIDGSWFPIVTFSLWMYCRP
ncbi:hypothetical protein [Ponticoccus alexandrii]|uniref:hypothetical protein n=1 Tax=Ponticoccus alexandrii TaxID=1943633 RepID=UPI003D80F16C